MEDYAKLAEQKKQEIMQAMSEDITSADEDFSNALDVLTCFLRKENMSIIKELESVYNRKREQLIIAAGMGILEGMRMTT